MSIGLCDVFCSSSHPFVVPGPPTNKYDMLIKLPRLSRLARSSRNSPETFISTPKEHTGYSQAIPSLHPNPNTKPKGTTYSASSNSSTTAPTPSTAKLSPIPDVTKHTSTSRSPPIPLHLRRLRPLPSRQRLKPRKHNMGPPILRDAPRPRRSNHLFVCRDRVNGWLEGR